MAARTPFAVWFALSAAAFGHAAHFGTNFPYMDEWPTVAALEGSQPVLPWLVEWHNEHLLPVPRAVYWGLFQLTGDLRAGMIFSVAVWSALSLGLMRTAARLRGRTGLSDVLFPLLLLQPGQGENWVMSYQVGFALSTGLAGAALILGVRGRFMGVAAVAAVLPFCGAHGAAFAGPFALFTAWHRRAAWPFALVAVFGVSLYATHRPPTPEWVPPITVAKSAAGFAGYEAMGFGPVGELTWPASAVVPVFLTAFLVIALKKQLVCGLSETSPLSPASGERVRVRGAAADTEEDTPSPPPSPPKRGRGGKKVLRLPLDSQTLAIVAYLAGAILLAAVIGVARGRYGMFAVFFHRYAVLSAAIPVGIALLSIVGVRSANARSGGMGADNSHPSATSFRAFAERTPTFLAAIAAVAFPFNAWVGWHESEKIAADVRGCEAELRAGVPPRQLAEKYHFRVFNNVEYLSAALTQYAESHGWPRSQPAFVPEVAERR